MKKRFAAVLLLMALGIGQLPAFATYTGDDRSTSITGVVTVINPLYGGTADDVPPSEFAQEEEKNTARQQYGASTTTPYTTIADAADFVRSQMANRQQVVTLAYRTTIRSTEEDPKVSIVKQIASQALDETGNANEGDYLRWQYGRYVCNIQGEVIVNGDGTSTYSYKFIYSFEYYTTAEQERELNDELTETLQALDLDQATDYQKIQRIYSFICGHVSYNSEDSTTQKYTAYSALKKGNAVCQGYALLLYRMLREAGFSTRIIAGTATASGENHAWNIVRLGDSYYYLDSTWDSGMSWYDYFMRGTEDFHGHQAWDDYTSDAFTATYPISETTYEPGLADEPERSLLGTGTCGADITWRVTENGALILRGSGDMESYEEGQTPWAELTDQITALDIGCGITSIGSYAFANCTALNTAVILPDSVKKINSNAFAGCTALPSIDILPVTQFIASDALPKGVVIRGCTGSRAEAVASLLEASFEEIQSIADTDIQLSQTVYTYTGETCTPSVAVTDADGSEVPCAAVYDNNVGAGTAQVMVSGTGAYGGKTAIRFTIEKAVPQVETPGELAALCGQSLRDVLHSCHFTWQEPEQSVGIQQGEQTFLMTYTPLDTQNYTVVTDIPVTVSVHDSIGLSGREATTHVGADMRLIASAIPNNAPENILFWSSDTPEVADVGSDGIVTAHAEGTAVITVRSVNGEYAQCTVTVETLPFTDVSQSAWYYSAVSYALGNNLFAGITETTFGPNKKMTRAMLVQVLYSMSGLPEVTGESPFSDVEDGKWYTDAVIWASENGVAAGTGKGKFSPNAYITREQTATILYKYADLNGYSTTTNVSISRYDDDQDVSNWAIHAMQWAVGNGLISGTNANQLQPRGKATRAQLAQIMMKFRYNIVYG